MDNAGRSGTDTFDAWKDYRKAVTEFIIENSEKGSSAAILGAGRCNDMDLSRLSAHFSGITLIDRDTDAMREALGRFEMERRNVQPPEEHWKGNSENGRLLTEREKGSDGIVQSSEVCEKAQGVSVAGTVEGRVDKISLKKADFTGINEDDFRRTSGYCSSHLVEAIKTGKLREYGDGLIEEISGIYQKRAGEELKLGTKEYDYAIVFGTHSQLNNNFSAQWYAFSELVMRGLKAENLRSVIKPEFERIAERVEQLQRENTGCIIERFDNAITELARKGLLLGIESGNTGKEHSEIDGAYNAILDFSKRIEQGKMQKAAERKMVWPFSKERGISYDVSAVSVLLTEERDN